MTDITPDEIALEKPKFDDRIDIETRIGNLEVARILGRSLKLLASFPKLFFSMLGLSALAIIPGLYFQWAPKIIIDQVILQKPIEQTETPFPPHMTPLVNAITGLSPMETLVAMTIFLLVLLCIAGRGRTDVSLSQGEDSATQAENQINEGDSQTSGVIGLADTLVQIRLSQQLTNRLRTTLFQRMARLPMTTLDDHRIGDAVYRVMYDAPMLQGMCYQVTVMSTLSDNRCRDLNLPDALQLRRCRAGIDLGRRPDDSSRAYYHNSLFRAGKARTAGLASGRRCDHQRHRGKSWQHFRGTEPGWHGPRKGTESTNRAPSRSAVIVISRSLRSCSL